MEAEERQRQLNEGIAAVRQGDRARGRELLLRVVEADERSEPGWLWLAAALDDPSDQLTALENVLALNPRHAQAQARAAALRAQLGQAPSPAPHLPEPPQAHTALDTTLSPAEAAWRPVEPRATPPVVVQPPPTASGEVDLTTFEDDPYQCAYCGRPTAPEDTRCPFCGRDLLMAGFWKGGPYLYWLLILVGLQLQAGMLELIGAFVQQYYPEVVNRLPGVGPLLVTPLLPAALRLVGWAPALLLFLQDHRRAYQVAAVVALADGAWIGAAYSAGWLSAPLALVNAVLGGAAGALALVALISQAQARLRRRVVLARGRQSAPQMHEAAEGFARQGMWALAAYHWRRAIGKDPRNLEYYRGLGRAQVALKQYAQAVKTFRSGLELAPGDREFTRLIESVRAQARSS
ncbi:MAG: hypothetical protein IT317_15425 [Anaerolineales bacterium]|nr:hypothetical protein [Anaerolineales bacterium]